MFVTPSADTLGKVVLKAWTSQPGVPPMIWAELEEWQRDAYRFMGLAVAKEVQKANERTRDPWESELDGT